MNKEQSSDILKDFWKFFASVKLTVAILLTIAVLSIIGTFIPQLDVYHSWWFRFFLIILTLNIIVCSLDRISATWKIVFIKNPPFHLSRFRKMKQKKEFQDKRTPAALEKIYMPFVSGLYSYCRLEKTDEGFCIFAEKWRWTRLGVYVVHLSVVLLLFGSLISSIFGFEGLVNIPEGSSVSSVHIRNTDRIQKLGFEIRCDDFNVSYYDPNGRMPKEFRSTVTIIENGNPVLKKDIIMNDPLRYKGINFFQNAFGEEPVKIASDEIEISLNFKSRETGMVYTKKVSIKASVEIPEGKGTFTVDEYIDSAEFRGHAIGQAVIGTLRKKNGTKTKVVLPLEFSQFDKMRDGEMIISAHVDLPSIQYTVLQVTKDPGVPIVYTGFAVLIIGIAITFFMSHQRICADVRKKGKKSAIMLAGTSSRNNVGMQHKIDRLSERLSKL